MAEKTGYTQTIDTAEFTETPRLVLEQPVGDVTIEGWDRPAIEVGTPNEDDTFDVEVSGSQIMVRGKARKFGFSDVLEPAVRELNNIGLDVDRMAARVERKVERHMRHMTHGWGLRADIGRWMSGRDYRIKVPHNCDLTLRTSSGDLSVKDVNGTVFVQSSSGDIRMQRINGNVLVNSASGDIEIRELTGKLGAHTASGDLTVQRASVQELGIHTVSGDVELELVHVPEREFEVKSVSGDLRLKLPAEARLTAEMTSLSGDLKCRLQHELTRRSGRRNSVLTINGGGPAARFSTVSGDVRIEPSNQSAGRESTGEPTADLSRPQPDGDITEPEGYAARRQAELDVLQALERGDITSQEAMNRLSDLG